MGHEVAKIAAISCTHSPHTPSETHQWILDTIANTKGLTHFVHCGDVFDAQAASVHPDEADHTLMDEYRHAASFLKSIRQNLPDGCRLVICEGNHDDNIRRADPRRIPKGLRETALWMNTEFAEEFKRWHWRPYIKSAAGCYRVGQVVFYHGFDCGLTSDELEGLQMNNQTGCHPFRLFVRGHTHRPLPPTQIMRTRKVSLPWWCMNVGTCGPLKPDYMTRKDTGNWGSGLALIEARMETASRLNAKEWEAELRTMPC